MKRRQRGLTLVEFALVGPVALTVLFGCIEIGRALFVWNTVCEATRRGARVAVVSPVDPNSAVVKAAVRTYGSFDNMENSNISIRYLDATGTETAVPASIRFVTVGVAGLPHRLLIPFVDLEVQIPAFATTLPTESLGFVPPP